jgi:hypothetical protein
MQADCCRIDSELEKVDDECQKVFVLADPPEVFQKTSALRGIVGCQVRSEEAELGKMVPRRALTCYLLGKASLTTTERSLKQETARETALM